MDEPALVPASELESRPPGTAEAIELYEAAARHYTKAAYYTVPVSRISSTSASLAASFPQ